MTDNTDTVNLIERAGKGALEAGGPEDAIAAIVSEYFEVLGDRQAHLAEGALKENERQYFVAGAFMVTPDTRYHMLVGNRGFPPEQRRLTIPIDAAHPGWVFENRAPLILRNTDDHGEFRQYLRSSRMGSSIYAPMIWRGHFHGQLVMAAQARWTMREEDLKVLRALATLAMAAWIAHDGPAWLSEEYPPEDADLLDHQGVS
ncbi:GAF domain-containing protein [Hoeflea sp.]|uniref:GAF domain-containing protein n=1 Tax=Hoeflea sp. TaxID=1940281 RepID=UPI003B02077D